MNKFITTSVFCATTLLLAACGGGGGDGGDGGDGGGDDKELDISLVGIPRSMVSAICFDENTSGACDEPEMLEYRYDFGGASIYQPDRAYAPTVPILIEVSDPAKVAFFDKTTLTFPGDSKKLSMDMFLKFEGIDGEGNFEEDTGFFLAHQHNLNLLGQNGLTAEEATNASLDKLKEEFSNLSEDDKKALADDKHKDWIEILSYNHSSAYAAAQDIRGTEKSLVNDKLVEAYECKAGLVKTVQHYGIEDVFANGTEPSDPSTNILTNPDLAASAQVSPAFGNGFVGYDDPNNDRYFADEIKNLPAGISAGRIYIGFKSNGSSLQHNDAVYIGGYTSTGLHHYGDHLQDLGTANTNAGSPWVSQLVSTSNPTTAVYWNDFRHLKFNNGTPETLLNYVQANNNFDVLVQDDTSIDFITVATCSKADPVVEITPILENFQCREAAGERKQTILGGIVDAYANGTDTATPSSALIASTSTTVNYDAINYDKHFKDTLDLLLLTGYISRARLSVGVKALGSALHSNDRLYLGYTDASNRAAFDVYGNSSSSVNTSSEWSVTSISNGERILQSNFSASSGANSLAWLRTQNAFDLLLQDDTSADFVQLDVCMLEKAPCVDTDGDGYCDEDEVEAGSDPKDPQSTPDDIDGDGVPNNEDCDPNDPDVWDDCKPKLPASCNKEFNIDLSPATSWLNTSGVAPTENNVFAGTVHSAVWDPALNWFDFGSTPNTDHKLKIDFCSCGGGSVTIDEMKSDNYSSIKLDNGSAIVERTAYSQSTMADWGAPINANNPNGAASVESFPHTGNGVNHSLVFKVRNVGGPSGGAVNGTLGFTGHLGKCTKEDVLPK